MHYLKPFSILTMLLLLMATSCKKQKFKRQTEGTYSGTWSYHEEILQAPAFDTSYTGTAQVRFSDKEHFTVSYTNRKGSVYTYEFEYNSSNKYTQKHNGNAVDYGTQVTFDPGTESLSISSYSAQQNDYSIDNTFEGKKQ